MRNIFETSGFQHAIAALSKGVLGGQPNATESAAYSAAQNAEQYARGLAHQEALKKARDKEKEAKKGKKFGQLGSILGTALGGPLGGFVGGVGGTAIGGGDVGDAAVNYGVPAAVGGLGDYLTNVSSVQNVRFNPSNFVERGVPDGTRTVTNPTLNRIGTSLKRASGYFPEEDQLYPYTAYNTFSPYGG